MITHLEIANFKGIKRHAFSLKNLNILAGLNGMGKSSFIETILLLKAFSRLDGESAFALNNAFVELGTGRDVLYQFADTEIIEFSLTAPNMKKEAFYFQCEAGKDSLELVPAPKGKNVPSGKLGQWRANAIRSLADRIPVVRCLSASRVYLRVCTPNQPPALQRRGWECTEKTRRISCRRTARKKSVTNP